MKVFIDSSIICQDYFFKKPHSQVLIEGIDIVPIDIHISAVVIEEVVNRFNEDASDACAALRKIEESMSRLSNRPLQVAVQPDPKSIDYRAFLKAFVLMNKIVTDPYPVVSHEKLVQRDLSRSRPFKKNGSCYRDALIWEGVRAGSLYGEYRSVFLTNNTRDFPEGQVAGTDFASDFRNPLNVSVVKSVHDFNSKYIIPKLQKLEGATKILEAVDLGNFDLKLWIKRDLFDLLIDCGLEYPVAGFDEDEGSVRILDIIEFNSIDIDDVRMLSGNRYIATINVGIHARFSVSCDWDDYVHSSALRDYFGHSTEPFDSISAYDDQSLLVTVDIILNATTCSVESSEILEISGSHASINFRPGGIGT